MHPKWKNISPSESKPRQDGEDVLFHGKYIAGLNDVPFCGWEGLFLQTSQLGALNERVKVPMEVWVLRISQKGLEGKMNQGKSSP